MLLRNFPFVGEVRLTVLTRFSEWAIRSYRTIDRVGPSKRDFQREVRLTVLTRFREWAIRSYRTIDIL